MSQLDRIKRRSDAATEFNQRHNRQDGAQIVNSLADGLNALRDLLYTRVHGDVEQRVGVDSLLVAAAEIKQLEMGRNEIELYEIAESATMVAERRYFPKDDPWYLDWLIRLRLGEAEKNPAASKRLSEYLSQSPDGRRRKFSQILESSLPDAGHAPLVIYRLFPLAVWVATALAFGDHAGAEDARRRQVAILPGIGDCPSCHGCVLANEERCPQCGNPFWNYEWLIDD
ncbi:MAG TPA: hypothetical protein VMV10_24470 [Pirellulales bacterium]|nr:hypothetical protein [Pirellulales bacterium]